MAVGQRLGGLTLEKKLGEGGFGSVYLGRPDVGPPRAVKILSDAGVAEGLRKEAETLLALRHPRIVELVQADLSSDPPHLVMELVEGGSLAGRIPCPPEEALDVCRGVLEGLAHAHAQGVAHLDLKPTNVLMAADGPKLADFGLARAALSEGSLQQSGSSSGLVRGTLAYMAPEVREGKSGDARSDMYSFGLLLCELLTGKLPQPGDELGDLMDGPPPLWAEDLFRRCYCRQERRFADAGEALQVLAAGGGPPARDPAAPVESPTSPPVPVQVGPDLHAPAAPPTEPTEPVTRTCPYCAEQIQAKAIVCRYCHREVQGQAPSGSGVVATSDIVQRGAAKDAERRNIQQEVRRRRKKATKVFLGAAALLAGAWTTWQQDYATAATVLFGASLVAGAVGSRIWPTYTGAECPHCHSFAVRRVTRSGCLSSVRTLHCDDCLADFGGSSGDFCSSVAVLLILGFVLLIWLMNRAVSGGP